MSVRMPKRVYFADLTHTGQAIASNTFPLGVAFVASYARRKLGNLLETDVFKYPEELAKAVESKRPDIACFSNFSWNSDLSLAFAKRIKEKYPETIIVFGGPNYPIVADEQEAFLRDNPVIDFYVWLEGEQAFVDLYQALEASDFDIEALKADKTNVAGVHYVGEQGFTRGELGLRLQDLTETPSPYQTGMMDKFFDGILIPMLQTNRGCPFTCTFCTEGAGYYNCNISC